MKSYVFDMPLNETARFPEDFAVDGRVEILPDGWRIELSSWSTTSLFFSVDRGRIFFASHLQLLTGKLAGFSLDNSALSEFETRGYVLPPKTLWQGVSKLPLGAALMWTAKEGLKLTKGGPTRAPHELEVSSSWIVDLLHILSKAVTSCVQRSNGFLALSGGLDSRVVSMLLSPEDRRNLTAYTKCHPNLTPLSDGDVIIAQKVAGKSGIPHRIVENPKLYYAYLWPEFESHGKVVSGMYGGEILGGCLFELLPAFKPFTSQEKLIALLSASRSLFYDFVELSWASPYTIPNYTESPFRDARFLQFALDTGLQCFQSYQLYNLLYRDKTFFAVRDIPLQSVGFTGQFAYPVLSRSANAKALLAATEGGLPEMNSISAHELLQRSVQFTQSWLQSSEKREVVI